MRLLLDTHAFLWFIGGDDRLSPSARVLIEDTSNDVAKMEEPRERWAVPSLGYSIRLIGQGSGHSITTIGPNCAMRHCSCVPFLI